MGPALATGAARGADDRLRRKASSREGFVDERMELVLKPFEGADLLGKIRALLDNG